jgi:hypothetical protein
MTSAGLREYQEQCAIRDVPQSCRGCLWAWVSTRYGLGRYERKRTVLSCPWHGRQP